VDAPETSLVRGFLDGVRRVVAALPARWVIAASAFLGDVVRVLDRRGRRVARQNLDAVFGEGKTPAEKRRIVRASFRGAVRSVLLMGHTAPFTRERIARWLDVPADVEATFRQESTTGKGGVLVSGHLGNWELLLGLGSQFGPGLPRARFVAEALGHPALDAFLEDVRGTGGLVTVMRKGGARTLRKAVRAGEAACLLVDRNVRSDQGGVWAPFLGLMARTTPLPGWLAFNEEVPVYAVLCLPSEDGRYRVWLSPELSRDLPRDDEAAVILAVATRINQVLERVIRAEPEAWNWTLKRFKSRPTPELGAYPPYSLYDPDRPS
jgi:KDO2-lipid IV(A) lauroyltransferase